MEINDSDAANLCKQEFADSHSTIISAEATEDPDFETLKATENVSDNLLTNVQNDDVTADSYDKDAHNDQSHNGSNSKSNIKESPETQIPKSIFHLSDNMKKDLSMLAFPSKSHSRKKAVISSRVTPNSRITIAEALEKAEDARKHMPSYHKSAYIKRNISNLPSHCHSTDKIMDTGCKESQDVMRTLAHSDTSEQGKKKMKLDSAVTGITVADGSSPSDVAEEAASCSEGKTVSVGGKAKSPGTSRIQMTRRMCEVLKFTFIHEHFPSSVHMARLAKMMGLPWSQVRNWFTDRRVDNKKAGIYPRDKPLLRCPYCAVTLDTEADQKSHLFSTHHVRRILGPEYCGGATPESIKWKKLPKTVNAVSKMSGARILAVGFSAEDSRKKSASKNLQEKKVEPVVEEVPHSKELKKLWTEAMLLPEEKEPPLIEWKSVRFNQESNSDNKCEAFRQEEKDKNSFNLITQEEKERVLRLRNLENLCEKKMAVNSRVGSISASVGDMMPGSISDSLTTVENPLSSDVVIKSTYNCLPVNTSAVSKGISRHPSTKKSQSCQNMSLTSGMETPTKMTDFRKKLSKGGMVIESPMESQVSKVSMAGPQKALKVTLPNIMKPKSKRTNFSWSPNSISQEKLTKSSTFASQLMQDIEMKQEPEPDELWNHMNNITLYKADGSDAPEKCELAVVNANQQPLAINKSSATSRPYSPRSSQLIQKSSSVIHQPHIAKTGIKPAGNKVARTSIDKRKPKFQTQPLALASKASKANISIYEGNAIVGYQCPKCSKVYQTEWLMMKHSVTHFKYHCDICFQVYPDENMMKIHLLDHLSGAYEDEKYYCQFSCKVCHSLKCGCFEPTYCKPKELPRVFFRPQKAKRSKRGFTSKLNSGPNEHLKISLAMYKKLLVSGGVGPPSKETRGLSTFSKLAHAEDTQKFTPLKDTHKSVAVDDSQIPNYVIKEAMTSNTQAEAQKVLHDERDQEFLSTKVETSHVSLPREKSLDAPIDVSSTELEIQPDDKALEEKDIAKKEKQLNWNEVRTKFTFNSKGHAPKFTFNSKSHANSQPVDTSKSTETYRKGAKRAGNRKRTAKFSKDFTYEDTDFYYMCEICDASFSTKSELSEHMFLHRLKYRCRRGEKRNISSVIEEKEFPPKIKVHNPGDQANTEVVTENLDNYICEVCRSIFPTAADYRAHKILAHKEPKTDAVPQSIEVYRCNYCDKIYRRRRELKRHLKRDCTCAPLSLKGILAGLSISGNAIEETHYTTLKIDFDDRSDALSKPSGKCVKGPIVCRYCLAVTKREAEMKRHIWKFCLKVPAEIVKKFMDGASLEELGFKYIKDDKISSEKRVMDVSKITNTEMRRALNSLSETPNALRPNLSKSSSPKKTSLANRKLSPEQADTIEKSTSAQQSAERKIQTSFAQPEPCGSHSVSMAELESSKKTSVKPKTTAKQSPIKYLPKETKMESPSTVGKTRQSSTSTSLVASPVMQFPIVLPVMTASAKSKRPLVCGYCGIWYFREMAILKHMKERCIKIPELEKELLKHNPVLCNVPQKTGGGGIVTENGAVYKMVKVPEHLQNTPVPMPKDVSNEDIKELNANINAFNEKKPTKSAEVTVLKEQDHLSLSSPGNKGQDSLSSSSTAVTEQDSLLSSSTIVKEQNSLSSLSTVIKEQDSQSSSSVVVKEQDSQSSSAVAKEKDNLSLSTVVREQNSRSSSSTVVKEQDSLPSPSTEVSEQDSFSSSSTVVQEQECLSSSPTVVKEQNTLSSSSTVVKEQDSPPSSFTEVKEEESLSSSSAVVKEKDSASSSSVSSPVKVNQNTTSKRGSRCRRCHEHFRSQEAVLAHSSVHHGPKKGFYKCKLCHARLAKYKQLREHVWEHTDENPYRCHLCEVKYRSSDALVEHLHTLHQYTSINEKNLYKWLPGRHGRYRDIKTKNSSCEEKLDNVDTNLESLAEIMVITDKDICSKAATDSKSNASGNEGTKRIETNEESVDNDNMEERSKRLSVDSKSSSSNSLENNISHEPISNVTVSTDSNVDSNQVRQAVNVEREDNLRMEDQNTLEKSLDEIPCGSQNIKYTAALEENKESGRTPQIDDLSNSKSESYVKEQNEVTVIEVQAVDKVPENNPRSGQDDDFTGEGFLPLMENLDSVVETVHLTDKHLL